MTSVYSDSDYPAINVCDGKICASMPEWINGTIFDALGAIHRPAGRTKAFDRNLDSDVTQVQTYLGTYFPRSLAESFVIFDCLLSDKILAYDLACEKRLSICSVGTGTGGDLLGLLLAISKRIPTIRQIDIVSIEGNEIAHEKMWHVLAVSQQHISPKLNLWLVNHIFEPPEPFAHISDILPTLSHPFNFVISAKMLNELDSTHVSKRAYYEFCQAFTKLLKPEGLLMVLDVTSPNGAEGRWTPEVLNGQVNEFIAESNQFKTILPLLCNRFESECGRSCYTQNSIYVSHRNATNECSKICYRVIGHTSLAEKLSASIALWNCPITEDNGAHCQIFN